MPPRLVRSFTHCPLSPAPEVASRDLGCAGEQAKWAPALSEKGWGTQGRYTAGTRAAALLSLVTQGVLRAPAKPGSHGPQICSGTTVSPVCHESSRQSLVTTSTQAFTQRKQSAPLTAAAPASNRCHLPPRPVPHLPQPRPAFHGVTHTFTSWGF